MAFTNKIINNPATGQGVKFIQTAKDTNGKVLEMVTTYRPGSSEPIEHYHPFQTEDFTVISGKLTVRIDGQVKIFQAGDSFHVPVNMVHAMWNPSDSHTVVNWKVFPAMNTEHLLENNSGLAADGKTNDSGKPGILQVAIMLNKFSDVFRLAKPSFAAQKILFSVLSPVAYLAGYRSTYRKYID